MKGFYQKVLPVLILLFLTSPFGFTSALGMSSELIFHATAANFGIQTSGTLENQNNPDDVVELSLPGRLYNPPKEVKEVSRENVDRDTLEGAEFSFYSANLKGDTIWILDCWFEEEKT